MRTIAVLAFSVLLPHALVAQSELPAMDGARVRVSAPHLPAELFGDVSLGKQAQNSFAVSTPGGDARITMSLASTQRIQVSEGRNRLLWTGIGAGAGALVGAIVGGASAPDDPEGFAPLFGMIGGAGAGTVFGAVLGFAYAPERWRTVYEQPATENSVAVQVRYGARTKQFADGSIAVRGERNRRAGVVRGAIVIGGITLIAGGIDLSRDKIEAGEYIGTIASNMVFGGAIGYLISPRGWQKLPR